MSVTLHIERLIIEGLPLGAGDGPALRAALEAELMRLLLAGGLAPELLGGAAMPSIPASSIGVPAAEPVGLGRQIAQSVYGGIGGATADAAAGREGAP